VPAVQSNEVYPTPTSTARASKVGAASDKRFSLGCTGAAAVWCRASFTGSIKPVNSAAKLLAAMRRTQLDWQISDLQSVAKHQGLDWRHQKSSHCVFVRSDGRTLSVPAHRPIKPIYIRKFVELIDGA
jgi:predicted RNA binding protein YcfA (HicA-like mRNA interferase family)